MAGPPPARRRSPASWSDIPTELAGEVILRLRAHVDHVRFAAVCPQWRATARQTPLPPPLPMLVLQDGTAYSLPEGEPPFHFPRCAANHTDASGNWLVFPSQEDCLLRNAFSDAVMTLPALSRVRARHVNYGPDFPWMDIDAADGRTGLTLQKLLICSPHLIAALTRDEERSPMPIIRIALCQPGASSWWCVVLDRPSPCFEDMVFHQGQLYAFDRYKDALLAIDIRVNPSTGDPWVSQTRQVIKSIPICYVTLTLADTTTMRSIYLVESCGGLLMVCRTRYGTWKPTLTKFGTCKIGATGDNEFEVFKPDFKQSQWTKVTTIRDDQVLFLCRFGCSRSICVYGHNMQGGSIIFMQNDDQYHSWYDKDTISSCSIYNMKDSKVSTLLPMVSWKLGTVPGSWLFPHESGLK